ncbi:hypothetical protein [Haloarcula salinisoli]|uniref:Uncharacterized protein n=1 Tax=Haloarcula salinisoli TaxID=2487746 RepID=A0A8J7YFJ8_9EURY|nr:hypothetical protein [Halomicroarcula salinisoli]MBX0287633.1 hypothetical protein [Halomicroarcula salinisoli]MBX0304562.1 hypothetical protein [Halomicroarcula salinisoli]
MPARYDVLRYSDGTHRAVPAGDGQGVVGAHRRESRRQQLTGSLTAGFLAMVVLVLVGGVVYDSFVTTLGVGIGLGAVAAILRAERWTHEGPELAVSDASERVVRDYVDEFDPDEVTDPFDAGD